MVRSADQVQLRVDDNEIGAARVPNMSGDEVALWASGSASIRFDHWAVQESKLNIFVSYRREDSQKSAEIIATRLEHRFSKGSVFRDVDSIPPGADYAEYIERMIEACDFVLAIIGPAWESPRLQQEKDLLRIEIQKALDLKKHTIPVLVGGAKLPAPTSLPPSLDRLLRLQAVTIREENDAADIDALASRLERSAKRR